MRRRRERCDLPVQRRSIRNGGSGGYSVRPEQGSQEMALRVAIAGPGGKDLGAALLDVAMKRKWMIQELDSRALAITKVGRTEMRKLFGLHD